MRSDPCFAVCAPGLAPLTAAELAALGILAREEPGGVSFEADPARLYRANLHLRTATRVLLRLGGFRARTFAELERHGAGLPWERLLERGAPYRLRVSCAKSKLYHEGAVAERLHGVIAAKTGARPVGEAVAAAPAGAPSGEDPEVQAGDAQLLVVRFFRDECTVSADTSGAPLYMRGYRQELARAPLRETLAAAMLQASGWPGDQPLVDPFCGSGTIPIEAALRARRIPPGLASVDRSPRAFRFERWPEHDADAWRRCVAQAQGEVLEAAPAPLVGYDRDPGAVRAARANAARAGVQEDVRFEERAFETFTPPAPSGWLVTNPPYGVRVGGARESRGTLGQLGRVARTALAPWTVCALAPAAALQRAFGSAATEALRTRNGGIAVSLFVRLGEAPARQTPPTPEDQE